MRSMTYKNANIESGEGLPLFLRYAMTIDPLLLPDGQETGENFGVEISFLEDGKETETCRVRNISTVHERVEKLLELLWRNTVTPVSLEDVVQDYLA